MNFPMLPNDNDKKYSTRQGVVAPVETQPSIHSLMKSLQFEARTGGSPMFYQTEASSSITDILQEAIDISDSVMGSLLTTDMNNAVGHLHQQHCR